METRPDPAAVCSLSEDGLAARLDWIRREILPHAVARTRLDDGVALELEAAPGLDEKLERLIRLESECCPGLAFERPQSPTPGRLALAIRGIDPDASLLRSLGAPAEPAGRLPRLVKAAGAGAALSVLVGCVLPLAAVALLGAAALPLTALDGPVPLAIGALVLGAGAWWWLGREGRART